MIHPKGFRRSLALAIALPLVLLTGVTAFLGWQLAELLEVTSRVEHAARVIALATRAEKLVMEMETGVRGYLLVGKPEFLEPYTRAGETIEPTFDELAGLVSGDARQLEAVARLRADQASWARYARDVLALKENGGDYLTHARRGVGKSITDRMRAELGAMIRAEERRRDERSVAAREATRRTAGLGLALALVLGTALALFGRSQLLRLSHLYGRALESERAQAEAVRESEARFRTLADRAPALLWMAGPDGQPTFFNRTLLDFTGRTLEEEIERGWSEGVHPDDLGRCHAVYRKAFEAREGFRLDYRLRRADGEYRWVLDAGAPRFAPDGTFEGYIGSCFDITERKGAEEEIQRMNRELERRVAERTQELLAANKELETFSYSVSHDLRAPLRSVTSFSQVLLEDHAEQLDEEGRGHLRRVCAAGERMAQLIDDVLELSRVTRSNLNREEVDLSALAELVATDLRRTDPGREVEFVIEPGLRATGDERLLRIVLENLLGNAWKFTSKNARATIEVGSLPPAEGSEDNPPGEATYFVRDDGAGFDMSYAGRLFGAFQRLHGASEFAGTGIGLASVQRVVHRHGGRVWAEGAVGAGATMFFTLPCPNGSPAGSLAGSLVGAS